MNAAETVVIGENVVSLPPQMFRNAKYLKHIYCHARTAPSVIYNTFGDDSSSFAGSSVAAGEKILYVPAGATGYDTSYWASVLLDSTKCGFTISYTL